MPRKKGYTHNPGKGGTTFKPQPNASKKKNISGKKPSKKLPSRGK